MISGAKLFHSFSCAPVSAIRANRAAKINGAATALASVPATMAAALPAKAARSGRI